ncbi:amino acid adenylation domain-containing protein [Hyunsoonleella flava]|uniref:Amino acid adenylation domain-containing protein n=1 Tax=Hyunsoonleella flava TaxID=2527939 RepID=A0A4Q9FEY4_9FLAO|nr:amino acid adenylation domain-containing protein [Hyunsoonleella flava]TBN04427.1 amino acid adenylation domain-containing protein [Hyunsoonleella flava]
MSEKEKSKASLLERWKNKKKQEKQLTSKISKVPEGIHIPLSYGQKRLWFLQQMYPNSPFYNYSEVYILSGKLNVEILKQALSKIYERHDVLKSTYHEENGKIYQVVNEDIPFEINEYDVSAPDGKTSKTKAQNILNKYTKHSFDLQNGPLLKVCIIKLGAKKHYLQLSMHHIVTDEWSMIIFRKQLSEYYIKLLAGKSVTGKKNNIQFTDYAYWESKQSLKSKNKEYWKHKLSGEIPVLNLPTDYTRPIKSTFKGKLSPKESFSKQFSQRIFDTANKLDITPFVLILSVYYVMLYRSSGQKDILVGSPVTDRDNSSLESVFGFFLNTLVLRVKITPSITFRDFVEHVKQTTLEAISHKNMPFSELVKVIKVERRSSTNPFFRVMFVYNEPLKTPSFGENLEVEHKFLDPKVSKFDLTLFVSEEGGALSYRFEYSTELFTTSSIDRFQNYFNNVLQGIVFNSELKIQNIPILAQNEKNLLFGNTKIYENHFKAFNGIHQIIEQYAQSTPYARAVTYKKEHLTYKELNEKANAIGKELISNNSTENHVIGLCIERSTDMIVGILAILKSGSSYLPLDPEYPKERIDFMIEDAEVKTILTTQAFSDKFAHSKAAKVYIDTKERSVSIDNINFPKSKASNLAYIIYTSGSTGKPKGVPITHKNIMSSTEGRLSFYDKNPSAFLLMSSISFDSSKAGIFWTLCTGGNLVIAEKRIEQDIDKLGDMIDENNISHTLMLPSLYKLMLQYVNITKLKSLTHVMVAGEACSANLCIEHFEKLPSTNLYNEYGPTEGSVWCIAHKIKQENIDDGIIPIGEPVANSKIYLLDEQLNPVPFSIVGEIYLGGPGLTSGYIKRPDLNQKAFIINPFNPPEKLYKTGDLAKYNRNKKLEFLGRSDQQIKIRGYRVELSEIEKVIAAYSDDIDDTFVLIENNNSELPGGIDIIVNLEENINRLIEQISIKEIENMISSVKALSNEQKNTYLT